jgi:hypothetical protein
MNPMRFASSKRRAIPDSCKLHDVVVICNGSPLRTVNEKLRCFIDSWYFEMEPPPARYLRAPPHSPQSAAGLSLSLGVRARQGAFRPEHPRLVVGFSQAPNPKRLAFGATIERPLCRARLRVFHKAG